MTENNQKSELDKQTFKGSTSLSMSICKSSGKLKFILFLYLFLANSDLHSNKVQPTNNTSIIVIQVN